MDEPVTANLESADTPSVFELVAYGSAPGPVTGWRAAVVVAVVLVALASATLPGYLKRRRRDGGDRR